MKRRIRRRTRRSPPPAPKRAPDARAQGVKEAARDGALLVGGAKDPAETAAERLAARALTSAGGSATAAPPAPAPVVHRRADGAALAPGTAAAPALTKAAQAVARLGPGRGLTAGERGWFEPRLGAPLGDVRLHEGAPAARAADALGASAFAVGRDVAVPDGPADPATMAHELAHVAQGDGGPLRRKIKAGTAKQDHRAFFKDGYMVDASGKGPEKSGNTYTASGFTGSGALDHQIAQNMAASQRVFPIDGTSPQDVQDNFDRHVFARMDIVEFVKDWRIDFQAGVPVLPPDYMKISLAEADARADAFAADLKAKGKTDKQIAKEVDAVGFTILTGVFADISGSVEFMQIMDEFRKESARIDAEKAAGKSPTLKFKMACQFATMTAMYGASQSPIMQKNIKGKALEKGDKTDQAKAVWTDWVPGDWGYITNTGTKSPALGLEGENIIHVGDGLHWAHFNPKTPLLPLEDLFRMVEGWNRRDGKPSARLEPLRRYPTTGLK